MLLTITKAGLQRETEAAISGEFPKFAMIHIGDGLPHANPFLAIDMVNDVYQTEVLVVERLSAGAVKFHATIPPDVALKIWEIGLFLEDGTLYAYGDYADGEGEDAAFYQALNFAFDFYVVLAKEQLPPLEFTYTPMIDTALIVQIVWLMVLQYLQNFDFRDRIMRHFMAGW